MSLGNKRIMAKNIQHYMELNHKSRIDMCEALGVKYTTFTDWINGNTYPRIDKIELMANYFGINKSDLIEDSSEDFLAAFSRKLNYYMALNNMSQKSLAEQLDVSEATVSYWLNGIKSPRVEKIDKLCEIFNCTRSDLVEDVENSLDRTFIDNYRQLDAESQSLVDSLIKLLQEEQPDSGKVLEMIGRLSAILHS